VNEYDKSDAVWKLRSDNVSGDRDPGIEALQIDLSHALNGGGFNTVATFVDALIRDHRTIQQATVRWLVEVLVSYGESCCWDGAANAGLGLYDRRNEAAVELCKQISALVDETGSLPHI